MESHFTVTVEESPRSKLEFDFACERLTRALRLVRVARCTRRAKNSTRWNVTTLEWEKDVPEEVLAQARERAASH